MITYILGENFKRSYLLFVLFFIFILNFNALADEYSEVKKCFGIFGSDDRFVRLPGKSKDDYSRKGGGVGPSYDVAYEQLMNGKIQIKLYFLKRNSWKDLFSSLDLVLNKINNESKNGNNIRYVIRSGLVPEGYTLKDGALGAFDEQIKTIAGIFSKYDKSVTDKIIFNPNWEYTGGWFPWSIMDKKDRATNFLLSKNNYSNSLYFKQYWIRLHDIIEGTLEKQGQKILWSLEFAGANMAIKDDKSKYILRKAIDEAYPGDSYVDIFGCSMYGQKKLSENIDSLKETLNYVSTFAMKHNLKTGLSEFSTYYSDGDDKSAPYKGDWPEFFTTIYHWMLEEAKFNRLSHAILFDVDTEKKTQHSILFFDTRTYLLNKYKDRPYINVGMGDQWSNAPLSRKLLVEYFKW